MKTEEQELREATLRRLLAADEKRKLALWLLREALMEAFEVAEQANQRGIGIYWYLRDQLQMADKDHKAADEGLAKVIKRLREILT